MANKIEFKILGNAKNLEKSLKRASKSFGNLAKNSGIALAGMTTAVFGFIEAARQQELAINTLNQALKNQGNFSEAASEDLQAYAKELQSVSLFGDEAVLQAQSLIASFGFEGEVLKGLTKATLDLAQAKGMDLKAAGDLVSKSVGSTTNALTRYGISVSGAAGSTERAEEAIANINKLFGGQAEAAAKGLGATVQLKNAMGDLAEEIGKVLTPSVLTFTSRLKDFVKFTEDNPAIVKLTGNVILLGIKLAAAGVVIGLVGKAFLSMATFSLFANAKVIILGNSIFLLSTALIAVAGVAAAAFIGWKIGRLIGEVTGLDEALQKILRTLDFFGQKTNENALIEADALNAIAVARREAYDEANADKIKQLEADKEAQLIHEQEIQELKQETQDFIKENDAELKELSNIKNQEELDALLLKWQKERESLLNHLNLKLELLANAGIKEGKQVESLEMKKASIRDKFDKLEKKTDQTKIKNKKFTNKELLSIAEEGFRNASSLGKIAARISAVLEIKNAFMQGKGAVMKAWNSAPFPSNLPAVALTTASTGALIASMVAQSFKVGTPEIPSDMLANVHKGETIIPKTFSEGIREGDLMLSGGDNAGGGGVVLNFDGATFVGVTEEIVTDIFTKASEMTRNRTLISGVA